MVFAQKSKIDSLETKIILAHDTLRIEMLQTLASWYFEVNPETARYRLAEAMRLSKLYKKNREVVKIEILSGDLQSRALKNYDSALVYYLSALELSQQMNTPTEIPLVQERIASLFEQVDNWEKAFDYYLQALPGYRSIGNRWRELYVSQQLAYCKLQMGDDPYVAIGYLEEALQLARDMSNKEEEARCLMLLGDAQVKLANYKEAHNKYQEGIAMLDALKTSKLKAEIYDKIGQTFRLQNQLDVAINALVKSLDIRRQIKNDALLASSFNQIGALCIQRREYERAINNSTLGLKHAQEANNDQLIRDAYENLYRAHLALEQFQKSAFYAEQFVSINEMIKSEQKESSLVRGEVDYISSKQENEIAMLRQKEESARFITQLLISLLLLALVSAVTFIYLYRGKKRAARELAAINEKVKKQNKELQELNETKDKFFSIISHDLKGPLNSLTSFSSLLMNHTDSMSKEEIQMLAKDLDGSLKNLFALLENLLEWARSQTGNIELKPVRLALSEIVDSTFKVLEKSAGNKEINLKNLIQDSSFAYADKNAISTVIRNLVSNAVKFTPQGGLIEVSCTEWQDSIEISIKDNGVGMPADVVEKLFKIGQKHSTKGTANEKGTGLGLILCKEFVEKNGGKIWVKSELNQGSEFIFTLPLS